MSDAGHTSTTGSVVTIHPEHDEAAGTRQFAALVEHSPDAVLRFDRNRRVIFANKMAERYLGIPTDELLGRRIDDEPLPLKFGDEWQRGLDRVFQRGEGTSFEYSTKTRRGERFFEVRLVPERNDSGPFDAILAVARDVTKEHRHRKRLEESEERWRRLVDFNPDAIVIFADDRIVYANRACSRLHGVGHPVELIGRSVFDFFSAEDYAAVQRHLQSLYAGMELDPTRYRMIRADGHEIDVEVYSVSIRYAGRDAVQSVLRDVSEQREYEHKLIQARLHAEEVARLKSSIVTNLSHEIRTPLANVLGFNEVLREHVDQEGLPMLDVVRDGVERLMATLAAVLEIGRLEAGDALLEPSEVDLVALLRRVIAEAQPGDRESEVPIELDLPAESLVAVMDPHAVYEIVWRLVDNAIKFTHEGTVTVRLAAQGADACVTVEDTGIGIGPEFLPHVFDEFEQESKGMDRNYEGTGLGLSIVRRLAELSGARITVESTKGEGSAFTVCLPSSLTVTA